MNFEQIKFDKETGTHSIVEAGYKYEIPALLYTSLKTYILQHSLISRWYKQLSDDDREKVIRVSAYN